MAIFKTYSMRQKEMKGETLDVFAYDFLPESLRVQIVHILNKAVGDDSHKYSGQNYCFNTIREILCEEHAIFSLDRNAQGPRNEVVNYFIDLENVDYVLDVIEIAFKVILAAANDLAFKTYSRPKITPNQAVEDLNYRFKQHGIGYQFVSGQLIRVDDEFIHAEIILPTLQLLSSDKFRGANEEFLKAHEHYRHGRNPESLVDALKAMESVIKVICESKGWQYSATDSANKLLNIVFQNGLLPAYMESEFSAMRGVLEGGTLVVRNKLGGHGQGGERVEIPDYWARYALNTAASNIRLLVEASGLA